MGRYPGNASSILRHEAKIRICPCCLERETKSINVSLCVPCYRRNRYATNKDIREKQKSNSRKYYDEHERINMGIGVKIRCELHPQYFLPCIGCYNDTKIEDKIKWALKEKGDVMEQYLKRTCNKCGFDGLMRMATPQNEIYCPICKSTDIKVEQVEK